MRVDADVINFVPPTSNTTRSDAPKERLCRLAGGGCPSLLLLSLLEDMAYMIWYVQRFSDMKFFTEICKGYLFRIP